MATITSITLNEHLEHFIQEQLKAGTFNSVNEMVASALRLLEQETNKHQALIAALEEGERSPRIRNFDRAAHLKELKEKFLSRDV